MEHEAGASRIPPGTPQTPRHPQFEALEHWLTTRVDELQEKVSQPASRSTVDSRLVEKLVDSRRSLVSPRALSISQTLLGFRLELLGKFTTLYLERSEATRVAGLALANLKSAKESEKAAEGEAKRLRDQIKDLEAQLATAAASAAALKFEPRADGLQGTAKATLQAPASPKSPRAEELWRRLTEAEAQVKTLTAERDQARARAERAEADLQKWMKSGKEAVEGSRKALEAERSKETELGRELAQERARLAEERARSSAAEQERDALRAALEKANAQLREAGQLQPRRPSTGGSAPQSPLASVAGAAARLPVSPGLARAGSNSVARPPPPPPAEAPPAAKAGEKLQRAANSGGSSRPGPQQPLSPGRAAAAAAALVSGPGPRPVSPAPRTASPAPAPAAPARAVSPAPPPPVAAPAAHAMPPPPPVSVPAPGPARPAVASPARPTVYPLLNLRSSTLPASPKAAAPPPSPAKFAVVPSVPSSPVVEVPPPPPPAVPVGGESSSDRLLRLLNSVPTNASSALKK